MTEIDIMMKSFVSRAYSDLQTEFVGFTEQEDAGVGKRKHSCRIIEYTESK